MRGRCAPCVSRQGRSRCGRRHAAHVALVQYDLPQHPPPPLRHPQPPWAYPPTPTLLHPRRILFITSSLHENALSLLFCVLTITDRYVSYLKFLAGTTKRVQYNTAKKKGGERRKPSIFSYLCIMHMSVFICVSV